MEKKKSAAVPVNTAPTTEQWRRLYNAAAQLKALAPWRSLWDTDIITIQLPDQKEPVFCCVMGHAETCCGVAVYSGSEGLISLSRLLSADGSGTGFMGAFEQKCLMCYFGDREEVAPEDRAVMQALELKFRGRGQWIYFRAMEPGYFPWFLNAGQAVLLADALENLIHAYSYLLRGIITEVDFEGGETLFRFYSEEQADWLNTVVPLPPISQRRQGCQIQDELLVQRLKRQKKLGVSLELDSFYLPTPVQEKKGDIPYAPRATILVERDQGLALDQYVARPEEAPEQIVLGMLVNFIQKCGRPAAVYVRGMQLADYLELTCRKLGISLVVGEAMPFMDALIERILCLRDF